MAYSKVERDTWHDERVRTWPRVRRDVWFYLLVNPHMDRPGGRIGCYVLDPFYVAADLSCIDWRPTPQEVEAELIELDRIGRIVWDPKTRVVMLTQFFKHNQPENPNVLTAAAGDVNALPFSETVLKGLISAAETLLPERFAKGQPYAEVIADAARARLAAHDAAHGKWRNGADFNRSETVAGTVTETLPERYGKPARNPEPEPEPEPLPEPDPEPKRPTTPARAVRAHASTPASHAHENVGRSVEDFVSEVIILANRGMADAGIEYRPLLTTGKHRQPVFDWLQAGYSEAVIRSAVYHTARAFVPDVDNAQISSMAYFTAAVKRTHETGQASRVEIPPDSIAGRIAAQLPKDRNGHPVEAGMYRPKGSMADRDTNGPTGIVDTLNAVISKTATQAMSERVAEWERENPDDAEWLRQDIEEELDREISAAAETDDDPEEWPPVRKKLELASRFLTRVREKFEAGADA